MLATKTGVPDRPTAAMIEDDPGEERSRLIAVRRVNDTDRAAENQGRSHHSKRSRAAAAQNTTQVAIKLARGSSLEAPADAAVAFAPLPAAVKESRARNDAATASDAVVASAPLPASLKQMLVTIDAAPPVNAPAASALSPASLQETRPSSDVPRSWRSALDTRPALAEGQPETSCRQRFVKSLSIKKAENVLLKLHAVVEQATDLPIMDLLSSDPYVKVWHQESVPPQQPDSQAEVAPNVQTLPCLTSDRAPPVEFKSTSLAHLGQSPYVPETLNPIWRFRVEHEITLRPGHLLDKGWLVVEVWDHDRVGNDDPMGRIDIALEECEEDVVIDKWYKLGWVPGQTHPGPGNASKIKIGLLVSSMPHGLPEPHKWMLNSYDFVDLQESILAHHLRVASQEDELEDPEARAVMARCEWHLHKIVDEAFATFDVDGDGLIEPAELMHVMGILGEEMDDDEIAAMIVECKAWGQPYEGNNEYDPIKHGSADNQPQVFSPDPVVGLSFAKHKSGYSQANINVTEFHNMLTKYWVCRKYGSKCYGAVNDVKFRRLDKIGLKRPQGVVPPHELKSRAEELKSSLNSASAQMPPVPGWMADIAAGHKRMSDDKRVPEMFWFFLRRKMEQVLVRANKTGVKEVGFFRRDKEGVTEKSSLGYTIRNTDSRFSAGWDFLQVVLLSYVCVSVPYQTGFGVNSETGSNLWWWELLVDLYFVVDIGLNFRTPFYDAQGRLVYSSKEMAKHYLRGWLVIDIGSCASLLQYIFLLSDSGDGESDGASKARLTKVLRLLRLAKLLRLARLKRLLDRLGDDIVAILAPLGNVFVLLLATLMCMHLISCFWYLAGTSSDIVNGEENTGWVAEAFEDPQNVTIGTRYLTSLYGIMLGEFTLQPTDAEKTFALVSVIMNGFIYGAVAATLSSIMVMLKAPHAEYNAKMDVLKTWMRAKRLPFSIREQVEIFYDAKLSGSERKVVDQTVIINDLQPAPIATELVQILYAEIIERVPIFSQLHPEVIVKLCMLLQPIPAISGCPVVIQGRQASEMYVVLRGRLQLWEQTDKALIRVRCIVNGVQFWSTVYSGLEAGEHNHEMDGLEHDDMDDDEDERRRIRSRRDTRRKGLSLDNPTVREIQQVQRDVALLSVDGDKKMEAHDHAAAISSFKEALEKLETALVKLDAEMDGQESDLFQNSLMATQVETVKLHAQLKSRLERATQAHNSYSDLRKIDRVERQANPTGAIDLRGREKDPALAHRALTVGNKSIVQGVVRVSHPTLYKDFDPAQGFLQKPPKLRMNQTVDALEVRQGNVLGYLAEGDYFGESSLVDRRKSQYDRHVTAVENSDLAYLRKGDVLKLGEEFPELRQQMISFSRLRKSLEEPRRKFNVLDEDSSGSLDRAELKSLLRGLSSFTLKNDQNDEDAEEHNNRMIDEAINEMDWSGDGDVSFEEFEAWWIRRQARSSSVDAEPDGDDDSQMDSDDDTVEDDELRRLEHKITLRIKEDIEAVERRLDAKLDGVSEQLDKLFDALAAVGQHETTELGTTTI